MPERLRDTKDSKIKACSIAPEMVSEGVILHELDLVGYPLISNSPRSAERAPAIEVIESIITKYPDEYNFVDGIAILLAKADKRTLAAVGDIRQEFVNPTGYLLETTVLALAQAEAKAANHPELTALVPALYARANLDIEYIFSQEFGPAFRKWMHERRTALARKWHVLDYNREEDFKEMIERYYMGDGRPRITIWLLPGRKHS